MTNTGLMAYKIQQQVPGEHDKRVCMMNEHASGVRASACVCVFEPVSYTHLDVYKRQLLNPAR